MLIFSHLILPEEKEELASMFIPASALKGSGTLVFSEAYLQSTLFVTKGRIENAEKKQKGKRNLLFQPTRVIRLPSV